LIFDISYSLTHIISHFQKFIFRPHLSLLRLGFFSRRHHQATIFLFIISLNYNNKYIPLPKKAPMITTLFKRCLIGTFLLFLAMLQLRAQSTDQAGRIEGIIMTTSEKPAAFIHVTLKGLKSGATTDDLGKFTFSDIKPGQYTLQTSGVGFQMLQQQISVQEGQTLSLKLTIQEASEQLQTVEITGRRESTYKNEYSFSATKTQVALKDIPQTISTITKELIIDQQSYRLQDVVKNVSGANQFSVYDDISIRGFRSSENRLLNGLRFAGNFWTSPLLVNIERVEVIKGPASAMFGNTNPGGTINMVTKKPLEETRAGIQVNVGSFKTTRTTADFTGALNTDKTLLYRLNLGYENSGSFREQIKYRTLAIAPSISFLPNSKTRINLDMSYQDINTVLDRGRTVMQNEQNLLATPIGFNISQPGDMLRPKTFSTVVSWSQQITDQLNVTAAFMRFREDQQLQEHAFNGYITRDSIQVYYTDRLVDYTNNNLNLYASYKLSSGQSQHLLLAGYDYADYDYNFTQKFADDVFTLSLRNPTYYPRDVSKYNYEYDAQENNLDKYSTHGFYVQDQFKWRSLQLLLSLRHERYNIPASSASAPEGKDVPTNATLPRVGLVYSISKSTNVYATYNQGFQVPDPSSVPMIIGGAPKPVTSKLYEAGVKSEWFGKQLLTTLSVYNLTQNNVITNANDPGNPDLLVQRGQERATGVEAEVTGNPLPNLSIILGYAYNHATITRDADENLIGMTKENAPRHNSNSWIKYTFTGKLKGFGLGVGHSQNSVRNGFRNASYVAVILPEFVVFNAMAYYQVDRVRLSVNANNLANKTYFTGGYNFQRNYPGAPRNFLASVAYTF
jgi:iron complex outermembrane receptor protein